MQGDTKPTFEAPWRAYGSEKRGGKPEARAAWKALPPETDFAAVIAAAAAWHQSWAAQNNPRAGRYTLAKWLTGERYEQDAPTGYQKVEKASSAKSATPSKAKPGKAPTERPTAQTITITGAAAVQNGPRKEL
jgi:hypothetical protein